MLRIRLSSVPSTSWSSVRAFSSTPRVAAEADEGADEADDGPRGRKNYKSGGGMKGYERWLQTEGEKYRRPTMGPNWLFKAPKQKTSESPAQPTGVRPYSAVPPPPLAVSPGSACSHFPRTRPSGQPCLYPTRAVWRCMRGTWQIQM